MVQHDGRPHHPPTTQALRLCVGSKTYQELPLPGGHVGVFVGGKAQGLYAELAPVLDPGMQSLPAPERAQAFVDALAGICRDCKVPASLAEVGVSEADLPRLAEDAMKQTRLLVNNPREVTYRDAYAIYSEALDGKERQAA